MQLSDLIGKEILISIPFLSPTFENVTLRGVDSGGIWIESQNIANITLVAIGSSGVPTAIVLFFPYNQIRFAMAFAPGVSLNEKALGV
jgi:hypothetical protein